MQLAILGRQPKLSLAELEALFGADALTPVSSEVCMVNTPDPLRQDRLGGTLKSARLLTRLENTDITGGFAYLARTIPEHLSDLPEGKLQFGVSIYGAKAQKNWMLKQMLTLKKLIKKSGRGVRIIENKSEALESAVVLYNKLTGPLGWEILLVQDGNDVIIAQTTAVQNIDDYSERDFGRPKRDAFVGMLPPKLAQIMINLSKPHAESTILDPFCGTGVVLQEALLMGYDSYGSDLSQKMIDYSQENLEWLCVKSHIPRDKFKLEQADATGHQWDFSKNQELRPEISIACETYLGKPLTSLPQKHDLDAIINESNTIAEGFLKNISSQLKQGTRLCVAVPAWFTGPNNYIHLKMLDHLTDMGYNRLELKHASKSDLIYHRPDQIVARELILLEKK